MNKMYKIKPRRYKNSTIEQLYNNLNYMPRGQEIRHFLGQITES